MTTAADIKTVAVLGSGTMGAGIAALCASAGARVLLLDMPAKEGPRSAIAEAAKQRMTAGKQPMLDDAAAAGRVFAGNFDDDMARLAEADWIVEVVVEDLAIKRALFGRIEAARRDGSIVTTNTSGIVLRAITEGLPERLRRDVAVTHFFNPVKVMKLVELVPGAETRSDAIEALAGYLGGPLGKGVVWAKDTVNFIANRIGCFWLLAGMTHGMKALEAGLTVEDLDACMGAPVGVPSTGLCGLVDLVGLDVLGLVAKNMAENLSAGDAAQPYTKLPPPVAAMLARGQIGRKKGEGFYRVATGADGGRVRETFEPLAGNWRPGRTAELPEAERTLDGLLLADSVRGRFAWGTMGETLLYAADLVPEIADDIVNVDRAMRWGFAWKAGPFEMLDRIGPARVIERVRRQGGRLPRMLALLETRGAERFYADDGRSFLGIDGKYHPVPD